jgi:hypothetical protein
MQRLLPFASPPVPAFAGKRRAIGGPLGPATCTIHAMSPASRPTTLDLRCPSCTGTTFHLRVMADEAVALAHCVGCERNHLVLDSEEYWFDLIQASYPRLRKCTCKASTFALSCHYAYRDDGDVRQVDLHSACTACTKARRQMRVEVDYSPTEDLITRPLRPCERPDLRYDLREVSLYLMPGDMASVVGWLGKKQGWSFVCWCREGNEWVRRSLGTDEVQQAVLANRYLHVYASPAPLHIEDQQVDTSKRESTFWKREQIIRISSPITMVMQAEKGLLYFINFANEYVDGDAVVPKPASFTATTGALLRWLGEHFVSWRGQSTFDNAAENLRLFGDRFSKGRRQPRTGSDPPA